MGLNELVQRANDIIKSVTHPDLKDVWAELRTALSDVREENQTLKDEVRSLKSKIADKQKYAFRDGKYWDDVNKDQIPLCKRCWEDKNKPYHLSHWYGGWFCDLCGWYCDEKGVGLPTRPGYADRRRT